MFFILRHMAAFGLIAFSFILGKCIAPKSLSRKQLATPVIRPLVKDTAPAVVNIYTVKLLRTRPACHCDPFFDSSLVDGFGPAREGVENKTPSKLSGFRCHRC